MIREVILNIFASTLSKKDRDRLNSAVRSIVANPRTFLDNKTFNEFQEWLGYRGGRDKALSPLTFWQMLKQISHSSKLDMRKKRIRNSERPA